MRLAFVTLSAQGARLVLGLKKSFPEAGVYISEAAGAVEGPCERFSGVAELTQSLWGRYDGIVYAAPAGAVVRAVSGALVSKKTDPAVVVMDVLGRWAVSLLSGHEGGANDLAFRIANAAAAEPVITTTTEAAKDLIVGVGARRGKEKEEVLAAIDSALAEADARVDEVRLLATADIKGDEAGIVAAAEALGVPLRLIPSEQIKNTPLRFEESEFVKRSVGLPAVAEPAALLAGRRTRLILGKKKLNGVTVAIARESSSSSE
ncbi:MAG: cobalamin biosynthesis protein [Candidatus Nitrospinota bacterium M3_3B_026]